MLTKYNQTLTSSVLWNLFLLSVGAIFMAISIQSVIAPQDFVTGGIMGISLLLSYYLQIFSPLIWYMILCVPIYIGGWFFLGRRFMLYTIYGTLIMTVLGSFIQFQLPIDNQLYAAVVAGVLNGAGSGIMLRSLGSSGGTDIISVLLKTRWNIPIGQFNFIFNAMLFLIASFRLDLDLIIVSIIMMFIASNTLEYVLSMFNRRKLVLIISNDGEAIGEAILASEKHGVTMLRGKGGYSGKDREILLTVTNNVALKRLENLVYSIDPGALFIVESTFYVSGGQFSRQK